MNLITIGIISLSTGILASLGLGGGMILIVYLTLFAGANQLQAQGINLIFFIPIAILSIFMHNKNGLIEWKVIFPAMITGLVSTTIFSFVAKNMDTRLLGKAFAVFMIILGVKELFVKKKTDHQSYHSV